VEVSSSLGKTLLRGFGLRALCKRHWAESGFALTEDHLVFLKPGQKKPRLKISISSIIQVTELDPSDCPIPGVCVLQIGTLGRCHYLMLKSEESLHLWANKLQECCQVKQRMRHTLSNLAHLDEERPVSDIEDSFLVKSGRWKPSSRRLLNCRKLLFVERVNTSEPQDPIKHVEQLLEQAFTLETASTSELIFFLDGTCRLADSNVLFHIQNFTENQKVAFFLNLYHLMVLHGFIVLGSPHNAASFTSFFTQVSYEVGGDIISLAELEHQVIRASMHSPQQIMSKMFIPQSKYDFAPTLGDARLLFAVNCGSVSNFPSVPIYKAETLDHQLTCTTQLTLKHTVQVDFSRKRITVPKVFQWYQKDFGRSSIDFLRFMKMNSLDSMDQKITWSLQQMELHKLVIVYDEYRWKCQQLSKIAF